MQEIEKNPTFIFKKLEIMWSNLRGVRGGILCEDIVTEGKQDCSSFLFFYEPWLTEQRFFQLFLYTSIFFKKPYTFNLIKTAICKMSSL